MSNFWDMVLLMISTFFFVAYLIIMFQIVIDLFRDHELGGGSKVLWVIGLIFLPVLTAIIYIVARGKGMAARQQASVQKAKSETESYIKTVAGKSPAADIAEAKALLDAGTISARRVRQAKGQGLVLRINAAWLPSRTVTSSGVKPPTPARAPPWAAYDA